MTEMDLEIQDLRRENEKLHGQIKQLSKEKVSLEAKHAEDLSEIVRLRRMVEAEVRDG